MSKFRAFSQLTRLASCLTQHRETFVSVSQYHSRIPSSFCIPKNFFWSKKQNDCDESKNCCCAEETDTTAEDAVSEYCEKTKNAKDNLNYKLKCAKEDYQSKLQQLNENYKCKVNEIKNDYECQKCLVKREYKADTQGAKDDYCDKIKPPEPVCCVEEQPTESVCGSDRAETSKKKKELVQDPCGVSKGEKKDELDDSKKSSKKVKKDDVDDSSSKTAKKSKKSNSDEIKADKKEKNKKAKDSPPVCAVEREDISKDTVVTSKLTGMKMPALIFGTYKLRDVANAQKALKTAFSVGYRAIDTSICYGNDDVLGCILSYALEENGLQREDIFIINKLPNDAMRCEVVCETLEKSLENLKTPYIDLFMINFPVGVVKDKNGKLKPDDKIDHNCIWKCMESLVDNGKTKYIGVANFNGDQLENLVERSKIKPSTIQVEMHAYFQQKQLRKVAKSLGVPVTAYAPLGISSAVRELLQDSDVKDIDEIPNLLKDPAIECIASTTGKKPGQILLRYLLQMDDEVAVVIGASNPTTIIENFCLFDFCLDTDEMMSAKLLDQGNSGRQFNKEVIKTLFPCVEDSPLFPWK